MLPDVAQRQMDRDAVVHQPDTGTDDGTGSGEKTGTDEGTGTIDLSGTKEGTGKDEDAYIPKAKRYHGSVNLDPTRAGRDASQIADEVISHLSGLTGANVTLTLEIEADIPDGAPDGVVRIVTENSRTLKFSDSGFEKE